MVTWSFPTTIVFGVGAVAALVGDHVKRLGAKRALVVCDPGRRRRSGSPSASARRSRPAGSRPRVFDKVDPNPVEKNVFDGVAAYRATARTSSSRSAAARRSTRQAHRAQGHARAPARRLRRRDRRRRSSSRRTCRRSIDDPDHRRHGQRGRPLRRRHARRQPAARPSSSARTCSPRSAILDPELTRSMPARVTAATGFDALTHCLEAYCSLGDHPMADGIALGGLELCAAHLARAVEHGDDLDARGGMMKAAMMGAVAFQKGLGACHSLAHPLSSEKGMHHGLANALCLPAVVDFNESAIAPKLARIQRRSSTRARRRARTPLRALAQARRPSRGARRRRRREGRHPEAGRQGLRGRVPPVESRSRRLATISPSFTKPRL